MTGYGPFRQAYAAAQWQRSPAADMTVALVCRTTMSSTGISRRLRAASLRMMVTTGPGPPVS